MAHRADDDASATAANPTDEAVAAYAFAAGWGVTAAGVASFGGGGQSNNRHRYR